VLGHTAQNLINSFAADQFFESTPQCVVSHSPLECNMW